MSACLKVLRSLVLRRFQSLGCILGFYLVLFLKGVLNGHLSGSQDS